MKKIMLLSLILASQTAWSIQHKQSFNGFYVKGGLGATQPLFESAQNVSYTITIPPDSLVFGLPLERNYVDTAFAGMLGFGYSYQVNSLWVLSAEFASQFTQAESSYDISFLLSPGSGTFSLAGRSTTTLKNDFALLIKPGIITQGKTQFYALLGPRWGNFETTLESSVDGIFFGVPLDIETDSNTSGYSLGFTVGVGVERIIDDGFSISLEYSYTSYGEIPTVDDISNPPFAPGVESTVSFTDSTEVSANTLMLDLSYRF